MSLLMNKNLPMNRFFNDKKGVAAVEFALILPLMLVLFFGTFEVTQAIMASRKLQNVVRVVTDLTGQYNTLTPEDTQEIFKAANHIMEPYDTSLLGVAISGVEIDEKGAAKIVWSFAKNGLTPKACGEKAVVPDVLKPPLGQKGFILQGDGMFTYTPATFYVMKKGLELTNSTPWLARSKSSITIEPAQCVL
jgi:Flp pilus assembly pilin Flp